MTESGGEMTDTKCPLGENCDLTIAYMKGFSDGKEQIRSDTLLEVAGLVRIMGMYGAGARRFNGLAQELERMAGE